MTLRSPARFLKVRGNMVFTVPSITTPETSEPGVSNGQYFCYAVVLM